MEIQAKEDYITQYIDYDNTWQDRDDVEMTFYTEVYVAAIRMADDTERRDNHCYNCKEKGHFWHQCTKPLKEEFQQLLDHPKQRDNELNKKGAPEQRVAESPNQHQLWHRCPLRRLQCPSKQQHQNQTPSILE